MGDKRKCYRVAGSRHGKEKGRTRNKQKENKAKGSKGGKGQ